MVNKVKCQCGAKINPFANPPIFFEDDYCSIYCREYYTGNYDEIGLVPKSDNKHHKNHLVKPTIVNSCVGCGDDVNLKPNVKKQNRIFCSLACSHKVKANPKITKPLMEFAMLRLLKHKRGLGDDFLFHDELVSIMRRLRSMPSKSPYRNRLRKWVAQGVIEKKVIDRQTGYRFNKKYINEPLGKLFYRIMGVKW